ncbi:MAG: hypothetical protein IJU57_06390, partial [Clostridia bacterium]|nr:hypothetical protein [Clostridia bacterium]
MKKILARTLLSVLLILGLMLGGCSEGSPGVSDRPEGGPDEQIRSEKEDVHDTNADTDSGSAGADSPDQVGIPFAASYIRTDGYNEETIYPVITLISSRGELDSYYAENCEKYHLGHREKIYSDSTVGFADACEKYDDGFFREHSLILVLVEEGSGSVRHEITAVSAGDGGSVTVDIVRSVPEEMTDDMAEWHIIIEISKEDLPEPPGEIYLRDQGGVSVTTSPVNVTAGNGCGRVSLKVPRTWTYEISEDKDKDTAVISISPRGCRGSIDIRYGAEMYGVCGTGLEEKDIMLGSHQAWQGFYDHGSVWSFMILKDLPVGYMFIWLNDDGNWYGQYEDEAME